METSIFSASTPYSDLQGTAAADRADVGSAEVWLKSQGSIQEGESLVGISLNFSLLSASSEPLIQAVFLLVPTDTNLRVRTPGTDETPVIAVRRVPRELSLGELVRLFKRMNLTLSTNGEFEGRRYLDTSDG